MRQAKFKALYLTRNHNARKIDAQQLRRAHNVQFSIRLRGEQNDGIRNANSRWQKNGNNSAMFESR